MTFRLWRASFTICGLKEICVSRGLGTLCTLEGMRPSSMCIWDIEYDSFYASGMCTQSTSSLGSSLERLHVERSPEGRMTLIRRSTLLWAGGVPCNEQEEYPAIRVGRPPCEVIGRPPYGILLPWVACWMYRTSLSHSVVYIVSSVEWTCVGCRVSHRSATLWGCDRFLFEYYFLAKYNCFYGLVM